MNDSNATTKPDSETGETGSATLEASTTIQTGDANRSGRGAWSRVKVAALAAALAGMVIGAVVEMFVQGALESTGWFGPTLETVIDEQLTNFSAIQNKLAELQAATSESDRLRLGAELEELLARQRELTDRTHVELRQSQQQLESLRAQTLKEQGLAGGVDFWLSPGESVSVGSRRHVFALNYIRPNFVGVTLSGERKQLSPGDYMEAQSGDAVYRVIYRMAPRESEPDRAGFDLVRADD